MERYPDVLVYGAEAAAPAAGTVLVDSGQLAAVGPWVFRILLGITDATANLIQIVLRNAANTADVSLCEVANIASVPPLTPVQVYFTTTVTLQRVVVRNKNLGAAVYIAAIFGFFNSL